MLKDGYCMQIADAVWMSMLLSAFAGILAVTVVVATFYFIRYAGVSATALPKRVASVTGLCSQSHVDMYCGPLDTSGASQAPTPLHSVTK